MWFCSRALVRCIFSPVKRFRFGLNGRRSTGHWTLCFGVLKSWPWGMGSFRVDQRGFPLHGDFLGQDTYLTLCHPEILHSICLTRIFRLGLHPLYELLSYCRSWYHRLEHKFLCSIPVMLPLKPSGKILWLLFIFPLLSTLNHIPIPSLCCHFVNLILSQPVYFVSLNNKVAFLQNSFPRSNESCCLNDFFLFGRHIENDLIEIILVICTVNVVNL